MQYNRYRLYRFYDNIDTTFVSIIGKANAKHVKKKIFGMIYPKNSLHRSLRPPVMPRASWS